MAMKAYLESVSSKREKDEFVELSSIERFADRAILVGTEKELRGVAALLTKDEKAGERIKYYLTEIAESRKRNRKTQTEINRLKKKTQLILENLS
jgi:hypothetical protein